MVELIQLGNTFSNRLKGSDGAHYSQSACSEGMIELDVISNSFKGKQEKEQVTESNLDVR